MPAWMYVFAVLYLASYAYVWHDARERRKHDATRK
jgi:hypothetical protein